MDEDGGGLVDLCAIIDPTAGENDCNTLHHGSYETQMKHIRLVSYRVYPPSDMQSAAPEPPVAPEPGDRGVAGELLLLPGNTSDTSNHQLLEVSGACSAPLIKQSSLKSTCACS